MMMFCTILVDLGFFDIIEVYFLVVGHTHCPLDQVISQLFLVCSQSSFRRRWVLLLLLFTTVTSLQAPSLFDTC
jgi:hypothetical protein